MVGGAYVTELLFFFCIVQRYEFVGDMGIVDSVYSKSIHRVLTMIKTVDNNKCDSPSTKVPQ